jgi:hypothetical protein
VGGYGGEEGGEKTDVSCEEGEEEGVAGSSGGVVRLVLLERWVGVHVYIKTAICI